MATRIFYLNFIPKIFKPKMACKIFGIKTQEYKQYLTQVENDTVYDSQNQLINYDMIINDFDMWFEKYLEDIGQGRNDNKQNLYHIISCLQVDESEDLNKEFTWNFGGYLDKMQELLKTYSQKYPQKKEALQVIFDQCQKEIFRLFDVKFQNGLNRLDNYDKVYNMLIFILYDISHSKSLLKYFLIDMIDSEHRLQIFRMTILNVLGLYNIKFL